MKSNLAFLNDAEAADKWDPPSLFKDVRADGRADGGRITSAIRQRGQGLVTALIFDCDGVLADTERDGHLPAFNQTFAEFGLAGAVVRGGVRREAARSAAARSAWPACSPPSSCASRAAHRPRGPAATVAAWHRRKTEIYTEMVAAGTLPGRPGHRPDRRRGARRRLVAGGGLDVAEASVRAVLEHVVGADQAAPFRRSSRATSCRARSRRPTSTCWRSSGSVRMPAPTPS